MFRIILEEIADLVKKYQGSLSGEHGDGRLRGEFIRRAKEQKRDYTVDWVHLKLNDQAQRTVLCKDPFKAHDERVEKLIASL